MSDDVLESTARWEINSDVSVQLLPLDLFWLLLSLYIPATHAKLHDATPGIAGSGTLREQIDSINTTWADFPSVPGRVNATYAVLPGSIAPGCVPPHPAAIETFFSLAIRFECAGAQLIQLPIPPSPLIVSVPVTQMELKIDTRALGPVRKGKSC